MKVEDLEKKLANIPTLPTVAMEINRVSQRDDFTARTLGAIIEKDPALAVKLLKLANSAYYGLVRQVSTVDRALTLLGVNTVRNLALSVSVANLFESSEIGVDLEGLWRHSLGCAVAAEALMKRYAPPLSEEAFLLGVIHDIGCLVLVQNFPKEVVLSLKLMKEKNLSQSEAEKEVIGVSHQEVGAFLADKWNFPLKYSRIVRLHHSPPLDTMDTTKDDNKLLLAVYVANQLAKALQIGTSFAPQDRGVAPAAWKMLEIAMAELPELRSTVKEAYETIVQSWQLT